MGGVWIKAMGLVLSMLLAAPAHGSLPREQSYSAAELVTTLERAGFTVTQGETVVEREFEAPVLPLTVNGGRMWVVVYPDRATAWRMVAEKGCWWSAINSWGVRDHVCGNGARVTRAGNLFVMMMLKNEEEAERAEAVLDAWTGPEPGNVPAPAPAGWKLPPSDMTPARFAALIPGAALTGERRATSPWGVAGEVAATAVGQYAIYVFPDVAAQEAAVFPLWPAEMEPAGGFRFGNLLVVLEPNPGHTLREMEAELQGIRAARAGLVRRVGDFLYARPVGTPETPTTLTLLWDDPEFLALRQARREYFTLEEVADWQLRRMGGQAVYLEYATVAAEPALRVPYRSAQGEDRVLYVAGSGVWLLAAEGTAEEADAFASTARRDSRGGYGYQQAKSTFEAAGLTVSNNEIRLGEETARFAGFDQLPEWSTPLVSVEPYTAQRSLQERLRTALAPLRVGWGRPVWEYGCAPDEAGGPVTGGISEVNAAFSFCARPEPTTFRVLVPSISRAERLGWEMEPAEEALHLTIRQGDTLLFDGAVKRTAKLTFPYPAGDLMVTVTGHARVTGRLVAEDAAGAPVTVSDPTP